GIFPASEFFVAFTITITRIALSSSLSRSSGPGSLLRLLARGPERLQLVEALLEPLLIRLEVGGVLGREVLGLEERADLDLRLLARHRVRAAAHPLDGLVQRLDLPDPVARDELLGLGEGSVDDGPLLSGREAHPLALAARLEAVTVQHDPGLDQLLVELPHLGEELPGRHLSGLGRLRRLHNHHDAHCSAPVDFEVESATTDRESPLLPWRRTGPVWIDTIGDLS